MRRSFAILGLAVCVGAAAMAMATGRAGEPEAGQVKVGASAAGGGTRAERFRELLAAQERNPGSVSDADFDAAAGQKDAKWSRLFWHTDLESAKAAARAEGKPILYLRMLGKLTDEYSCANSRFFRTVLYANGEVSSLMRDRFVMVWESERPVPQVTIDFGDGRVLRRTITGNSIHYVLDAEGNVVDALPGLYDPGTFAAILRRAGEAAATGSAEARWEHVVGESVELDRKWQVESAGMEAGEGNVREAAARGAAKQEVEVPVLTGVAPNARAAQPLAGTKRKAEGGIVNGVVPAPVPPVLPAAPSAKAAGKQAAGKTFVEGPLVRAFVPEPPAARPVAVPAERAAEMALSKLRVERPLVRSVAPVIVTGAVPEDAESPIWERVAAAHVAMTTLDANSIALIRSQNPGAYEATGALGRVLEQFRRSIAADTVRNNYLFRRQILGWLAGSEGRMGLAALNSRVYSELFLTPRSDPWLGLVPESTYSALMNDGCAAR